MNITVRIISAIPCALCVADGRALNTTSGVAYSDAVC